VPLFHAGDPVLAEIEKMNQRGGRMLSLVDLLAARTLTPDACTHLAASMMEGVSIACGALAGGTGKTTLLAALLSFAPPDTRIITVSGDPGALHRQAAGRRMSPTGKTIFLCHEISPGHYYSYLWGPNLPPYFRLHQPGKNFLAFTIHADEPEEAYPQLEGGKTGLDREDVMKLDLLVFIRFTGGQERRLTGIYEKDSSASVHVPVFRYERGHNRIEKVRPGADDCTVHTAEAAPDRRAIMQARLAEFFLFLRKRGITAMEKVREEYLQEFFPADHGEGEREK
jgi:hypothetical protein